jgi:hypothetical protein
MISRIDHFGNHQQPPVEHNRRPQPRASPGGRHGSLSRQCLRRVGEQVSPLHDHHHEGESSGISARICRRRREERHFSRGAMRPGPFRGQRSGGAGRTRPADAPAVRRRPISTRSSSVAPVPSPDESQYRPRRRLAHGLRQQGARVDGDAQLRLRHAGDRLGDGQHPGNGRAQLVMAGGVDALSHAPLLYSTRRWCAGSPGMMQARSHRPEGRALSPSCVHRHCCRQ